MKRTMMFLVLAIMLFFCQQNAVQGCESYGTVIGSYKGFSAHSNGGYYDTQNNPLHQCAIFAHDFYAFVYQYNFRLNSDADSFFFKAPLHGFIAYENGGNVAPTPDMILCYDGGSGGYGHVAIITNVYADSIKIIEENVSCNNAFRTIPMTVTAGHYTVSSSGLGSGYSVQGWLKLQVGLKSDGTYSQPVIDKYNSLRLAVYDLGATDDNGEGKLLHTWMNLVTIQDFDGPKGNTALILNPNQNSAWLLKQGFRYFYMNPEFDNDEYGPEALGAPIRDEYTESGLVKQDFEKGYMTYDATAQTDKIKAYSWNHQEIGVSSSTVQIAMLDLGYPPVSTPDDTTTHEVTITSEPTNVDLYLDNVCIGTTPLTRRFYINNYTLNARAYGYTAADVEVDSTDSEAFIELTVSESTPAVNGNFPMGIHGEYMYDANVLNRDENDDIIVSTYNDQWWLRMDLTNCPTGWLMMKVTARADGQIDGKWPKMHLPWSITADQEVNSTDWIDLFFYRYIQNANWSYEIDLAESTRVAGQYFIVDISHLTYVNAPNDPELTLSATKLDLGCAQSGTLTGSFTVTNSNTGVLTGSLGINSPFTLADTSFSLNPDCSKTFTVSLNLTSLSKGTYRDTISVSSNDVSGQITLVAGKYSSEDVQTAKFYAGAGDGRVRSYSDVNWGEALSGTNLAAEYTQNTRYLTSDYESGRYYVVRFFYPFNVSLPDTARIVAARFVFTPWDDSYYTNHQHVRLVQTCQDTAIALSTTDFDSVKSIALSDSEMCMEDVVEEVPVTYTLNAAGRGLINYDGWTNLGLRATEPDINGVLPSAGGDYIGSYFSENSGTDKDPYLEVDYVSINSGGGGSSHDSLTVYSGAGDGRVRSYNDGNWSAARSGSNLEAEYTQSYRYLNSDYESGRYYVVRIFLPFDTSSLPDDAVVDSAKLVFTEWDNPYVQSYQHVRLVQASQASATQLATSDFNSIGSTAGATDFGMNATSANNPFTLTFNSTGLSWISTTGWTKLGMRVVESDINNSAPSHDDYIGIYFSENGGTGYDPKLTIYYTVQEEEGGGEEMSETQSDRFYSGAGDGRVRSYSDASWAAAWTGSGLQAEYTEATRYLNSDYESGRYYICRFFLPFDTSELPDDATIDSVKFTFTEWDNPYIHSNQHVRLVEASQSSTSQLSTSDYGSIASVAGATDLAMTATSSNTAATMTMNATGLTWINKTSWTKLGLRVVESDINNSAPSTEDYIGLYFSEQSGTDKDPYIDVYYREPLGKKLPKAILPVNFSLAQNYPNPFNPVTTIQYDLPKASQVKLQVFNALGQLIITLVDSKQEAGQYHLNWNATNNPSGIYFFVFSGDEFRSVKKAVLMK